MNARDELAAIVALRYHAANPRPTVLDGAIADAILAAGYSKPRTITTVEELDALDAGTIVLEAGGNALKAIKRQDGKNWWVDGPEALSASALIPLPTTVIHEP